MKCSNGIWVLKTLQLAGVPYKKQDRSNPRRGTSGNL